MGSRWFFYPVHLVTGSMGTKIIDAPNELKDFVGRKLSTLSKAFSKNSQNVCDWINGNAPLILENF